MELGLLWVQLALAAGATLWAATYMAGAADVIALRTGLGRTFIGVVMLATATSLPELGTGVASISALGEPDLAAGDAFGSNLFNLLIIGLLDFFWRDGLLLSGVGVSAAVIGALGVLVIGVAATAIFIHQESSFAGDLPLSPLSVGLLVVFLAAMYILYRAERRGGEEEAEAPPQTLALGRAFAVYAVSAVIVVGAAVWLAFVGDSLAEALGLERSFIGTQFLALSTSLPELAASLAAVRLGAPELALSNVLGSNLFNMGFVLFIDDAVYTAGPVWEAVSSVHIFTALAAMLMTAVVIIALLSEERGRPGRFFRFEAVTLVALYLGASTLVYKLA